MNLRTPALFLITVGLVPRLCGQAQYDGDNKRYRTISWEELPAALAKSPDALLIDVRSPGEYSDTSHWASLNIGRLKGAKNIDHKEVGKRLSELSDHRDKPIYLYCSHSQRSRRVGNMLADSGYTKVINVNGGMSRYWNEVDRLPMMKDLVEHSTGYGVINAHQLCTMRAAGPLMLLDVRGDSLLSPGKRPEWVRAYGAMKDATHIPIERLKEADARIPRDRPVVLVGAYTADAAKAAAELVSQGHHDVHILFNGLEGMIDAGDERCPCKSDIWSSDVPYHATTLDSVDTLALLSGKAVVMDIRSNEEYEGTAKDAWMNTGRFRIAKHIAAPDVRERIAPMGIAKNTPITLIGRGLDEELFDVARTLTDLGYKNVSILTSGIWGVRWEAHNLPGHAAWDNWVVKYPTAPPSNP
ncbi:MAG: rhodanese-like domain-containing protein [Flavobacteriales bacterium]|nr:rhodanese-like domain-containing protein [Flavobacteriales bacterium]